MIPGGRPHVLRGSRYYRINSTSVSDSLLSEELVGGWWTRPRSAADLFDMGACRKVSPPTLPHGIAVRWINLAWERARAAHAEALWSKIRADIGSSADLLDVQRVEAVTPVCRRARLPCELPARTSGFNASSAYALEPPKMQMHTPQNRRAGELGAWLSHVSTYIAYASRAKERKLPYLLVVEDDVVVRPELLSALIPCLVSEPARMGIADSDWHAIRFSTWGKHFTADRWARGVYKAWAHSFNGSADIAYGGVHATLFATQRLGEVVKYMLRRGVAPVDATLRYGAGRRQQPKHAPHTRADGPRRLNVWVVRTPTVFTTGAHGWRGPS